MNTISSIYDANFIMSKTIAKAMLVVSFVIMTALGAYVRIPLPFTPVPITMQTFFVVLCGAVLGRRLGSFAQILYVSVGAFGVPVFQGYGRGFLYLLGPTGGYLAGFIIAAFLAGLLTEREKSANFFHILFSMSLGILAIYAFGISWLMFTMKLNLWKAISLGFVPFIPGAAVKLISASWIYSKIKPRTDSLLK